MTETVLENPQEPLNPPETYPPEPEIPVSGGVNNPAAPTGMTVVNTPFDATEGGWIAQPATPHYLLPPEITDPPNLSAEEAPFFLSHAPVEELSPESFGVVQDYWLAEEEARQQAMQEQPPATP
jgi:hypothetical protein